MSISGIIQGVTGQLRQYDPEELSEEMRDILEDIDKKIQEEQTKIDSIGTKKKYRNLPKADKEHLIKKHNLEIEDLEQKKKNILFQSHEKDFFHMETLSFDERKDRNVETDPDVSKEMRRRYGVSEGRRMRQQLAKEKAKAKRAAGEVTAETPKKGIANIIKADGKWGELSNLSKHSFTWDGKEYNSVEHAYQTNKSGKFDRVTYQAYIDRPEALKIVGKFKADYDTNIQLMEDLYRQMLNENPDMVKLLQETEGLEIQHQLKKSDIWTKEMPKILTKLRDEFKSTGFETVKRYTVADVQANPDKIYIFGDNTEGWGKGGQAIIRDEPNAFGIATKDSPRDFMSDDNFEANKARIDADIAAIKADGRPIVFPEDGIGTGRADLENKAPRTWAYLQEQLEGLKGGTPEVKTDYTKVKGPDLKDLPGTLSFIDDSPPELKSDLGLMYKMPPALVDGVAKVGAKVWNQALKAAPLVDEEILIQAPAKLVQQGLKGLGLGAAAGAVGTGATALGTYELFWMLINLGKAALNQAMGEAAEPGGVPPMLFSEHIELGENSEFDNAEQFMKDYETWAKGSVAVQAFRGVTGHDDPIEWAMSGFKKGDTKVNFFGYDWMKNVFSEASR